MKLKSAPRWDPALDVAAGAREVLPRLAADYFAAGRKLLAGRPGPKALHAFRIRTKRLRYTLELFQPVYGPGLAARLESLRKIQQLLGDINDCVVTEKLIRRLSGDGRGARKLSEALRARASQRRRKLLAYWRRNFDAPGEEQRWVRYLRAWAGRTAPARQRTAPAPAAAREC